MHKNPSERARKVLFGQTMYGVVEPGRAFEYDPLLSKGNSIMLTEDTELNVDRRAGDRREAIDRRSNEPSDFEDEDRREAPRRKVERRRQVDPTTCERDYDNGEIEFMKAMDDYKRRSGRQFPTWSEVLEVLRSLGYRKVADPVQIEI